MFIIAVLFAFVSLLAQPHAVAQTTTADETPPAPPPERIEIGLSTEAVAITSDFSGAELIIFGAVDNTDPLVHRQGRYDIFLILEGPRSRLVTRRKDRVFGIWMNAASQEFASTPLSYLIASTRFARDVTDNLTISRLSLAVPDVRIRPAKYDEAEQTEGQGDTGELQPDVPPVVPADAKTVEEFTDALRRLKVDEGLYRAFPGNVQFISQSLFRAELSLPANVPLGNHRVTAYLFRTGQLVTQTQATLRIEKAGFEFEVFRFAHDQPLYYGLISVLMALIVGWLGRVLFKKD